MKKSLEKRKQLLMLFRKVITKRFHFLRDIVHVTVDRFTDLPPRETVNKLLSDEDSPIIISVAKFCTAAIKSKAVESGASQINTIIHAKSNLNRILKQLVILKQLKGPSRRIKWLCELAYKYQKALALRDPLDCSAAPSASGINMTSEDPLLPSAEVVVGPVAEPSENPGEQKSEADPSSETSTEAPSLDLSQALRLQGLPQRLHLPAPKMLCRPSPLRWNKPCCTRSCYETLDRVVTFHYARC